MKRRRHVYLVVCEFRCGVGGELTLVRKLFVSLPLGSLDYQFCSGRGLFRGVRFCYWPRDPFTLAFSALYRGGVIINNYLSSMQRKLLPAELHTLWLELQSQHRNKTRKKERQKERTNTIFFCFSLVFSFFAYLSPTRFSEN